MASAQFFKRLAPFLAATISLIAATDALALTPCANLVATRAGSLFYEARFVGLVGDKLTPVSELGTLQRRYTNAFERQRLATFDRQRDVAKQGDLVAWMRGVTP